MQRALATLLNACRAEMLALDTRRHLSHGFRESQSIITNAHCHTARRYVLNLDLADFFPSLNFGRVRGFFQKDKDFELNEKVATVLAQIACFENALPQGSPCSPVIADMVTHILDARIVKLAKKTHVTYSRYADDLSFSTNQRDFPAALAITSPPPADKWIVGGELTKIIERSGFKINPTKTRMQFRGSRQVVTGLTVNTKVNVSQRYWRQLRSMCHSLYDVGEYYYPILMEGTPPARPIKLKSLEPLAGLLSHAYHVKRKSDRFPNIEKPDIVFGHAVQKRFWFYNFFVAPTRPLLVSEGATDIIYLRNAIQQLATSYPQLGNHNPDGFKYKIAQFSYTNLVHKILGISGGIGPILNLVHGYRRQMSAYRHRPLLHPVIVIVDNDTAIGAKVCAGLKKRFGIDVTYSSPDPFFHLTDNLYLVKTPLVGAGTMSCIEDLFDAPTKAMPLDGKTFHNEKAGFDATKHIGKVPFATKVVAVNAGAISWAGFAPLLDRIVEVLIDYAAKSTLPTPSTILVPPGSSVATIPTSLTAVGAGLPATTDAA